MLVLRLSIGPRKGVFFLLAKTRPGEEGIAPENADSVCGDERTRRMLEGNVEVVGIAGRTLTEVWGDREERLVGGRAEEWIEFEFEDVELALEWV